MKNKIKNVLSNISLIDAIGTIILISVITLILILFFFHSSNYIAHFTIASLGVTIGGNNHFIIHPEISFEREEFKKQRKINTLFKINILKAIKEGKSKNFVQDTKNVLQELNSNEF